MKSTVYFGFLRFNAGMSRPALDWIEFEGLLVPGGGFVG